METKILSTDHGNIELPVFMPVGTKATVKAMPPAALNELDVNIILANTYHFFFVRA
jgi:queuine tRNA-ribosyltransferase